MIQNLLVIISGLIGFFVVALIYKNYKSNSLMNVYIILIITTISARFVLLGLTYFISDLYFKSICSKYSNVGILIIPLFYLYFKKLSNSENVFQKKDLLHFIFPMSFFLLLINQKFYKLNDGSPDSLLIFIFLLYINIYNFLCYKILKQNIWLKNEKIKVISRRSMLSKKWTYFLFLAILLLGIRMMGSIFFENNLRSNAKGYSYQWVAAIIWLFILFKIMSSPEILYGYNALDEESNENRNENLILNGIWNKNPKILINNVQHLQLKQKIEPNILNYIEKIENISLHGQLFRNSAISIADVANKLNAPKSHVSYLFKYHSSISFSEYKKVIRIQDALTLIKQDYLADNTLDYLSKKVGFPSYSTFFTSFKEISGISPNEYCKKNNK
jgi:AraC-like DNA-binding protein